MCVVRLLIKISTVAVTAAQFCVWTRYSWERRRSQYNICFPHELNIVLEGCKDLRTRLEFYTPLKKGFIFCSLKVHTFKKFGAERSAANLFSTFFLATLRAAPHGLYTSNSLPTPMVRGELASYAM